jgi:hypothetical protein
VDKPYSCPHPKAQLSILTSDDNNDFDAIDDIERPGYNQHRETRRLHMADTRMIENRLKDLSETLRQRGESDLATEVGELIATLQGEQEEERGLVTTGEAARLLGVRSINTIKLWVWQGTLDGVKRGGRWLVTSESVRRVKDTPPVSQVRQREKQMKENLEEFTGEDEGAPATNTWMGRKPWEKRRASG